MRAPGWAVSGVLARPLRLWIEYNRRARNAATGPKFQPALAAGRRNSRTRYANGAEEAGSERRRSCVGLTPNCGARAAACVESLGLWN